MRRKEKVRNIVIVLFAICSIIACAVFFAPTKGVKAVSSTVTTETELRGFTADELTDTIYVDADSLTMTSYIRMNFGPKTVQPAEGRERVTLEWPAAANNYSFYIGDNAKITFKNFDIVIDTTYASPINVNVGGQLIFDNCTITYGGTAARVMYGDASAKIAFKDTVITNNAASAVTNFFYRPSVIFSGSTEIKGLGANFGSAVVCTDFREIAVAGNESEGLLLLEKTGVVKDKAGAAINGGECYLFYTTDGSDPQLSGAAYGSYIDTTALDFNTVVRVAVNVSADKTGIWSPSQYTFKVKEKASLPDVTASDLVIDYTAETLTFDAAIEVSSSDSFDGTAFTSGGSILPGSVWYARYIATQEIPEAGKTYTLNVKERPETPTITTSSITANSITLSEIAGAKYKLETDADYSDSCVFTDLEAGTEYSFSAIIPASASSFCSEVATGKFSTLSEFGEVNAADYEIRFADQTIAFVDGVEANTAETFDGQEILSGDVVTPNTTVYLRYRAAEPLSAGPVTAVELPAAPEFNGVLKLLAVSRDTIVLAAIAGGQFKIGGG